MGADVAVPCSVGPWVCLTLGLELFPVGLDYQVGNLGVCRHVGLGVAFSSKRRRRGL